MDWIDNIGDTNKRILRMADDLQKKMGLNVQVFNNEIWVPVSTRSFKQLKKNEKIIVKLVNVMNKMPLFLGFGKIQKIKGKNVNVSLEPLIHDNASFKFSYHYKPCEKKCSLQLQYSRELEPTKDADKRRTSIEKKLYETIISLTDAETDIEKQLDKKMDLNVLSNQKGLTQKLTKQLNKISKERNLKQKTLTKVRNNRMEKEKTETDLYTVIFSNEKENLEAIIWQQI